MILQSLYTPYVLFILPSSYLSYVFIYTYSYRNNLLIPSIITPDFIKAYNIFQIVLCSYMTYGLMPVVSQGIYNPFGINIPYTDTLEWFMIVHYLSKYVDWIDTYIIIQKQKQNQLSFLHVYHHSTVPVIWGFMLYNGHANGTVTFGAWINSLTHVIMYTHYLVTSYGIRNPFKKYVTYWQISQFYFCLMHAILLVSFPEWDKQLEPGYAWIQLFYHISLIILFTKYMSYVPSIFHMKSN